MPEWKNTFKLNVIDCDVFGRWKFSDILRHMQQAAEENAEELGCGRRDMVPNGICWVLYRLKVAFESLPKLDDEVTITTWPSGLNGLFFLRKFRFEDANGVLIGEGVTTWVLFSLERRRVMRPSALPVPVPEIKDREVSMREPAGLDVSAVETVDTRRIYFSDLDMNGHMNNARYADWSLDLVDDMQRGARGLQINFIAEGRLGDEVTLAKKVFDDGHIIIEGKRNARTMFEAEIIP